MGPNKDFNFISVKDPESLVWNALIPKDELPTINPSESDVLSDRAIIADFGFSISLEPNAFDFLRIKSIISPSYIYHSKRKGNMRRSKVCGKYNNKPRVF